MSVVTSPIVSGSTFGSEQDLLKQIESNAISTPQSTPSGGNAKSKQGLPSWASSLLISLGLSIVLTGVLWAIFYGISRSKTKKTTSALQQQQQQLGTLSQVPASLPAQRA